MTDHTARPFPTNTEAIIGEFGKTLSSIGFKLAVLEMAVLQSIETMPPEFRRAFSEGFTQKAADLMQRHAGLLLPADDVELLRTISKIQAASK